MATVVVAVAAVMVAVPALLLLAERPAPFGWQMFSTVNPARTYVVETGAGEDIPVSLDDHVAVRRAEPGYHAAVPGHLCDRMPEAVAVRVDVDGETTARHRCP